MHRSKIPSDKCWYSLIRAGLSQLEGVTKNSSKYAKGNGWLGTGLQISSPQTIDLMPPHIECIEKQNIGDIPTNLRSTPKKESSRLELILPSRQNSRVGENASETRDNAICRLLELLTKESVQNYEKLIRKFFSQAENNFDLRLENDIKKKTLKLIDNTDCRLFFGSKSQSNFEVTAIIDDQIISAQVDRVLIEDDKVVVIDFIFKDDFSVDVSNSVDISKYQKEYLIKMAGYRSVFRRAFSDHKICCVSLLIEKSEIIWLPDELLDDYSS